MPKRLTHSSAKTNFKFRLHGLGSVLEMTVSQVRAYSKAILNIERERLRNQALATRAGMADEKSFKARLKALD